MKQVLLSDVCDINPVVDKSIADGTECSFVPMEYVDEISGTITKKITRRVAEVKKGYTFFRNDDVIFAKITPCMENGKCAIAHDLKNGIAFGSTEFHVVRANDEIIPEWIYYYLRQEHIRQGATRWFRGTAGQQRVPTTFLEELRIPLPSLPEQRRIADLLSRADRLRRLRRYGESLGESLLQSVFLGMFGDPASNPKKWKTITLGEKLTFITSGSRGWAEHYTNKGDLFLRVQNVGANQLLLDDVAYVQPPDNSESRRTRVRSGDLLLSATADIGRTGVIPENFPTAYINQHLFLLRLKDLNPIFVAGYFCTPTGKGQILRLDREGVKSGLNFDDAKGLTTFNPPAEEQQRFAAVVRRVEGLRARARESARQGDELFQALLAQSFGAV